MRAEEGEGDDRHGLLSVVRAVAEGDEATGEELELAERAVGMARPGSAQEVKKQDGDDVRDEEANDRRRDEGDEDRIDLCPYHCFNAVRRGPHAIKPSDQRVRGAGGKA